MGFYNCKAHNPIIAAIDLGTNSCRLLIASVNIANLNNHLSRSTFKEDQYWNVIDSFAKIIRLGDGIKDNFELSEASIKRTIDAIICCKNKLSYHDIFSIRAVATQACRIATNTSDLLTQVREKTGINIEVISTKEEGRLALLGCMGVVNLEKPYGIVFDIGGGSTEIVFFKLDNNYPNARKKKLIQSFSIIDFISIPYGVVVGSEMLQKNTSKIIETHTQIREEVYSFVKNFILSIKNYNYDVQLIACSGTVTTLAAIGLGLKKYERRLIDGKQFQTELFHKVSQMVLFMDQSQRQNYTCVGASRWDLIIAGSAILEGILDALELSVLKIADRGVREGILFDLLQKICKQNEHLEHIV